MPERMIDPRHYLVGPFDRKEEYTDEQKEARISIMEQSPAKYHAPAKG